MSLAPAPLWLLVQESPVDPGEQQRASGLIVHRHGDESPMVHRGVTLAVGSQVELDEIAVGDVVYYLTGYQVGEHHLVPAYPANILGWEKDG